jgi:hypothetical protein
MTDPVILSSGQTYQRDAIAQHLKRNKKDPMTNEKLKNKDMVPNMSLRHAITAHLADITSSSTQTSPKVTAKTSSKKQTTRKNKKDDERKKRAAAAEKRNKKKMGGGKPKHTRRKTKASRSKKTKTSKRSRKK